MIKILLAGEGGQGVQTVAKVITEAAQNSGLKTSYIPSFGVEQRGGVSLAYIQIDQNDIPYPRFEQADIVVVFCDRAIEVVEKFITPNTLFMFDDSAIHDDKLSAIKSLLKKYIAFPAQRVAQEKYSSKALNMVFLGALAAQLKEITFAKVEEALTNTLGDKLKDENIKNINFGALREGAQLAEDFNQENTPLQGAQTKDFVNSYTDNAKTWTRFPQYCKGCTLCATRCPVKAIQMTKDVGFLGNPLPIVDINKCIACGMCEKTCPDGAIKIEKKS